jgi:hypothetical protein
LISELPPMAIKTSLALMVFLSYPDKTEKVATKTRRHEAKPLFNFILCVFGSWWQKCFAIKCKEIAIKILTSPNM